MDPRGAPGAGADGSLFLNVGAKPTDPGFRSKSRRSARRTSSCRTPFTGSSRSPSTAKPAGAGAGLDRDLAVGHYKPINSDRFVNDCHEFIFHFTPGGRTRLDRRAVGVPYQDRVEHHALGDGRRRPALPRQHLVHPLRDDPEPRPRPAAPGVVPAEGAGAVPAPARPRRAPASCSIRSWAWASSAVAAARLGLDFVGIEMDDHYLQGSRQARQSARQGDGAREKRDAVTLGHHVALALRSDLLTSGFDTSQLPRISPCAPSCSCQRDRRSSREVALERSAS